MRKITSDIVGAFVRGENKRSGNTVSEYGRLLLHGNCIAVRNAETGKIRITNARWFSATTKDRLNAIPGVNICQKNFDWFLNGSLWDGSWIDIN